jgi:hypothetical protein
MKSTFRYTYEWSDYSEHSPRREGQLPAAVILPDGKRVEVDADTINCVGYSFFCAHPRSRAQYVPMTTTGSVRARLSGGGDPGDRRYGATRSTLEVIAPRGSRFMFAQFCPFCGGQTGEQELPGNIYDERADEVAHPTCAAEYAEKRRLAEIE